MPKPALLSVPRRLAVLLGCAVCAPAIAGLDPMMAEISLFAFDHLPKNWMHADGQTLSINPHQALFSTMGTAHGGNGQNNFKLPDLRGRSPVGATANMPVGTVFGQSTVSLNVLPGVVGTQLTLQSVGVPTSARVAGTQALPQVEKTPLNSTGLGNAFSLRPPSQPLHHAIATSTGHYRTRECFLGEVVLYAGNSPPEDNVFLPADGRVLSVVLAQGLFSVIGNRFGGDGVSTFALPDLRGRLAAGVSSGAHGVADIALGQQAGHASVALTAAHTAQMPQGRTFTTGALGASTTTRPTATSVNVLTAATPVDNGVVQLNLQPPSLALDYYVCVNGTFPTQDGSADVDPNSFSGEIRLFAGDFAPDGWAFANGQLLDISSYGTLYSLIGTTFGGNGTYNFALPDLRGRIPVHPGTLDGQDIQRGQWVGMASLALNSYYLPAGKPLGDAAQLSTVATDGAIPVDTTRSARSVLAQQTLFSANVPDIELQPPTLGLHYIIRLNGIYPSPF